MKCRIMILTAFLAFLCQLPLAALASAAGAIQLPQTGQATSYGAGDDGAVKAGVPLPNPRFVDNNNGAITDNLTGLIWLKNAHCTDTVGGLTPDPYGMEWTAALTWSNALASGKCGLIDGSAAGQWRLPNRSELMSLVDRTRFSPPLPAGHPFTNYFQDWYYWTSSTYSYDTTYAWCMFTQDGQVIPDDKMYPHAVWPVRGGQ